MSLNLSDSMESDEIGTDASKDALNDISIKVKNYKCFGEAPQGVSAGPNLTPRADPILTP